jgi:N-sulfoglucosamine sulfohydrolase
MVGRDHCCTRRDFLGCGVVGAVAGAVGCGGEPEPGATATDLHSPCSDACAMDLPEGGPPNILFITLDDLGWTTLPAYGNRHIETPAIDRLVEGGVLFRNAFLVSSSCSPSRSVFLTGQYPHTSGVTGLVHSYPELALPPDHPTLVRVLADAGYACAIQGKWHVTAGHPGGFGFHEFFNDVTGTKYIESAARAVDFIARHRDGPFYLELDFIEPHKPWEEHDGLFVDPEAIEVLEHWMMPDWPEIRQLAALYFGEVRYVDRILADVFAALDDHGLAENTLVVLTSDNGAPLPGNKVTLYDRGIRTPLLVRWPAAVPAGARSDAIVSTIDLAQAIAIAATSEPAAFMQGDPALFDLLRDPSRSYRDSIYAEMTYHAHPCPARAVRTERWKYIRNLTPEPWGLADVGDTDWAHALLDLPGHDWLDPRPSVELYDLDADPHEVDNLADVAEYADVRARMHRRLLDAAAATSDDVDLDG